jgi:hypothetical protein
MDLKDLTADNTRPLVGTIFRLDVGDGKSVELTLDEVRVQLEQHHSKRMKRDSFSLYFLGPPNVYLQQGMYDTHHEALDGPMAIFYVPIGRQDDGRFEFEAVFT